MRDAKDARALVARFADELRGIVLRAYEQAEEQPFAPVTIQQLAKRGKAVYETMTAAQQLLARIVDAALDETDTTKKGKT